MYSMRRIEEALNVHSLFLSKPSPGSSRPQMTKHSGLQGTHNSHGVQLLSEWLIEGLNQLPWCYEDRAISSCHIQSQNKRRETGEGLQPCGCSIFYHLRN